MTQNTTTQPESRQGDSAPPSGTAGSSTTPRSGPLFLVLAATLFALLVATFLNAVDLTFITDVKPPPADRAPRAFAEYWLSGVSQPEYFLAPFLAAAPVWLVAQRWVSSLAAAGWYLVAVAVAMPVDFWLFRVQHSAWHYFWEYYLPELGITAVATAAFLAILGNPKVAATQPENCPKA